MRRFTSFCDQYQVQDPFPVTERLLCSFAAFLGDEGLAPQTVKSYLAAIRNTQLSLGLPDPREQSALPVLRRVLAGISRSRIGRSRPARIRLPMTAPLLRDIRVSSSAQPIRREACYGQCVALLSLGFSAWVSCYSPSHPTSTLGSVWRGGTWPWTIVRTQR